MTIDKIRENLKNTITGKELLLADFQKELENEKDLSATEVFGITVMTGFLEVNLKELHKLLKDIEACCVD